MDRLLWELSDELAWHTRCEHAQDRRRPLRLLQLAREKDALVCRVSCPEALPPGGKLVLKGDPPAAFPRIAPDAGAVGRFPAVWPLQRIPAGMDVVWCEYRRRGRCLARSNLLFIGRLDKTS